MDTARKIVIRLLKRYRKAKSALNMAERGNYPRYLIDQRSAKCHEAARAFYDAREILNLEIARNGSEPD